MKHDAGIRPMATEGEREARKSLLMLLAMFVVMILSGIWQLLVGTASMGGDESELVRGWEGVLRNLPGYMAVLALGLLSIWYGLRSIRHGARRGVRIAIVSCVGVTLILSQVTRDIAEVVMKTRAATVSWILFGVDAVFIAVVFMLGYRWATAAPDSTLDRSPLKESTNKR